ncbi:MAG: TIGR03617 family F420-dependent LLM class oxidoreductase [Nitrososphaerota archaeon]|nr:TIGR03617 family F420-dependent LLM class oxidoreductase [Nitrososphaerota archaeon]MDG6945364.1 TIGR03617 family F420-dependent LLM class oxidoreductase [Nitrososphaerota archaeon]MDG6949106.1 TIGR03617 family F420-dependent LLM class oxidoreductase [Nitrososphaerota archaeon]
MKIDAEVALGEPSEAGGLARKAEEYGFDAFWANETKHDPFVQLALAAAATKRVGLGTSIALAFTRSPTTMAYTSWDIQSVSRGRFMLGLGSQVKGHIERRFGMKWDPPAPKMREYVSALRSVWKSWQEGSKLDFRGRFYTLDLMTPFFTPSPIGHPSIPILVAGVNETMCMLAGGVADGLHIHPLHTLRYLREVIEPALSKGAARSGRSRSEVQVAASVFAAVGDNEHEISAVREAYREQIAFYASTRTYRRVMELHHWEDVAERLHALSTRGEWRTMASEVDDAMLEEFVVGGTWKEVGGEIENKYRGLLDRVRVYLPFDGSPAWQNLVEGFRA